MLGYADSQYMVIVTFQLFISYWFTAFKGVYATSEYNIWLHIIFYTLQYYISSLPLHSLLPSDSSFSSILFVLFIFVIFVLTILSLLHLSDSSFSSFPSFSFFFLYFLWLFFLLFTSYQIAATCCQGRTDL